MTMPSAGRIVHYVARGSADGVFLAACRTARGEVTESGAPLKQVSLCVLNPTIPYDDQGPIDEDGTPRGGTWHWPERV